MLARDMACVFTIETNRIRGHYYLYTMVFQQNNLHVSIFSPLTLMFSILLLDIR